MKATKNNGTFEALNTREGIRYIATRGDVEVWVSPISDGYLASLFAYNRPAEHVEGETAKWALHQLAKACAVIVWDDETFFDAQLFPIMKDLNDFMKRPPRETYNSR